MGGNHELGELSLWRTGPVYYAGSKVWGAPPCFPAIYTKGNNFYDFQFAFWMTKPVEMGFISEEKNAARGRSSFLWDLSNLVGKMLIQKRILNLAAIGANSFLEELTYIDRGDKGENGKTPTHEDVPTRFKLL